MFYFVSLDTWDLKKMRHASFWLWIYKYSRSFLRCFGKQSGFLKLQWAQFFFFFLKVVGGDRSERKEIMQVLKRWEFLNQHISDIGSWLLVINLYRRDARSQFEVTCLVLFDSVWDALLNRVCLSNFLLTVLDIKVEVHISHLYEAPCRFCKALIVVLSQSASQNKIWEDSFFFFYVQDH